MTKTRQRLCGVWQPAAWVEQSRFVDLATSWCPQVFCETCRIAPEMLDGHLIRAQTCTASLSVQVSCINFCTSCKIDLAIFLVSHYFHTIFYFKEIKLEKEREACVSYERPSLTRTTVSLFCWVHSGCVMTEILLFRLWGSRKGNNKTHCCFYCQINNIFIRCFSSSQIRGRWLIETRRNYFQLTQTQSVSASSWQLWRRDSSLM